MKTNEIVRRTIADAALSSNRRWSNLADIAHEAQCSVSSVFKATQHLAEIGAVRKYTTGGLSVLDPERVVTVLAVGRDLERDTVGTTSLAAAKELLRSLHHYALGGADAAVHHLGGANTVADKGQRIVYVPAAAEIGDTPRGREVRILRMDAAAHKEWRAGFSGLAQTYADLFAQPGWQASEFRRALWRKLFAVDDWPRGETHEEIRSMTNETCELSPRRLRSPRAP